MTNLGDSHQDGRRAGIRTKAENGNSDSEAMTNRGNSHQDRHRAGDMTKAKTDIGDSKVVTNLGDSPGRAQGRRHDQGRERHW